MTNNLEVRSFQVRAVNEDKTFEGLLAPTGETYDNGEYVEAYGANAFDDFGDDANILLYAEHDHLVHGLPVGKVIEGRNTDEGLVIRAKFNDTTKGNDAYALVKDGSIKGLSAGFNIVDSVYDAETNVVTHNKIDLKEASITATPAFKTAGISAVRSLASDDASSVRSDDTNPTNERGIDSPIPSENNMTENNYASAADLDEIRSDIDRRFATIGDVKADSNESAFRNGGDFLKALSARDAKAIEEVRAYTGATSGNSHQAHDWKGVLVGIAQGKRPLVNVFGTGPLGDSGNTVEYGSYTVTGAVASQANEGDDLGRLNLQVTTASTPVRTFGVASELSYQVIDRSDISFLDDTLKAQAASYANVTNAYVRSALTGASATAGAGFTLSSATSKDVLKAVVDGMQKIDGLNLGLTADAIVVSSDVFLTVATLSDGSNRPVMDVNRDGANTIGSANGLSANVYGIPVVVDAGLAAKSFYIVSSSAVGVWENAGAPVALSDDNILNLTKPFSLYGYLAAGVKNAAAIVRPAVA